MIKALLFDVFGTGVDWRSSVISECNKLEKKTGIPGNWEKLTDMWRQKYAPSMDEVRNGKRDWVILDTLHKESLISILKDLEIHGLSEKDIDHLNKAWHRLDPWPDSVQGLKLLKQSFSISTLSNGGTNLLSNMANYSNLPWDNIFSAETFMHYKPDPEIYLKALSILSLKPENVMMIAAHAFDLRAAKDVGMQTAYVLRNLEFGENIKIEKINNSEFDIIANNFQDLAYQLNT